MTLASRFPAHDTLDVGGRTIHNAEDGFMAGTGGSETLGQIIEFSHNVGAAEVGLSIGGKTFYAMERRAGFGDPTGVGLPGENPGIVPPPAQWSGSSLATMSFGQGVSVTPLAMARYYCAIANGGLLMQPHIVRAVYDQQGKALQQYRPVAVRRVFSQKTAAELRGFLRIVVLARHRRSDRADTRLRDRRQDRHRVDGRRRRVPFRILRRVLYRHGSVSRARATSST